MALKERDDYRLLLLPPPAGKFVKWGESEFGKGATITYAVAKKSTVKKMQYGQCEAVEPLDTLVDAGVGTVEEIEKEIDLAFSIWAEIADVTFIRVEDPEIAQVLIGSSGNTNEALVAHVALSVYENRDSAIDSIVQGAICVSPNANWQLGEKNWIDGEKPIYSIRMVLAHEIGHILGLDHPRNKLMLMHSKAARPQDRKTDPEVERGRQKRNETYIRDGTLSLASNGLDDFPRSCTKPPIIFT